MKWTTERTFSQSACISVIRGVFFKDEDVETETKSSGKGGWLGSGFIC